jgi:hypothetical protein
MAGCSFLRLPRECFQIFLKRCFLLGRATLDVACLRRATPLPSAVVLFLASGFFN